MPTRYRSYEAEIGAAADQIAAQYTVLRRAVNDPHALAKRPSVRFRGFC